MSAEDDGPGTRVIEVAVPRDPAGVVLVLHGGASRRGKAMVSPVQLSVLRMIPIARRIARAGRGRLAVFRVLNATRGWDTSHTPVDDAIWAMDRVRDRLGELPICLVGHSLGGRAAILAAGAPGVRGAAALAPYVYPTDIPSGIEGRPILIVHGTRDRIASPRAAAALATRLGRITPVRFVAVEGGKHAMLSHHREFSVPAADFAASALLSASM